METEKTNLLEQWKKIQKREEKENPLGRFVIDEGEFVEIKSGVKQLSIKELLNEEEAKDGRTNDTERKSK